MRLQSFKMTKDREANKGKKDKIKVVIDEKWTLQLARPSSVNRKACILVAVEALCMYVNELGEREKRTRSANGESMLAV